MFDKTELLEIEMFFDNETLLTFKLCAYTKLKPYLHLNCMLMLN